MKAKGFGGVGLFLVVALIVGGVISFHAYQANPNPSLGKPLKRFDSCSSLAGVFKEAQEKARAYYLTKGLFQPLSASAGAETGVGSSGTLPDYSETNVQVEGVDEADIVKTDGKYIYTLTGVSVWFHRNEDSKLIIAKAYPPKESGILSETTLNIRPREMFIHGDYVLIFGSGMRKTDEMSEEKTIIPFPQKTFAVVQIWDTSDKRKPSLIRSVEFEGDYVSSRKIGPYVYFVINSYPDYRILESGESEGIIPLYRDRKGEDVEKDISFSRTCGCSEVEYFEPVNPERFVTLASISLENPEGEITKEVIIGSGHNVYASLENLYIAETSFPFFPLVRSGEGMSAEKTIVHKFSLENGKISYAGHMEAPGRVLNQFSMDEYDSHFRIATTKGRVSRSGGSTSNNIYIFDENLKMVGKLENIAPGESIYSARFMGDRGYLVTFKKIDPFFVVDLSDPKNPKILGKLKIPGYSDYLHPYDSNHIIGIGKETVEAEEEWGDFSWYQGVKLAIFDVTDVGNPEELHRVVIGDRGTDSYALHDHKAFLFDREKNLLVIPILLAEIKGDKESLPRNTYGNYVFQGAYVYDISLDNGFVLKGRITHYETSEPFMKSGYYFMGEYDVKRSLYIDNVLYTISGKKIKLNSLDDLSEIKELVFG